MLRRLVHLLARPLRELVAEELRAALARPIDGDVKQSIRTFLMDRGFQDVIALMIQQTVKDELAKAFGDGHSSSTTKTPAVGPAASALPTGQYL